MPWNCQSLQHIASYCRILHQSKNSFLSPSSSQVQNSAKLPVQHHFSTIRDLQAAVLAFKPFLLSPHACGPHATSCNLWKLTQGSLTPRPPLDYLNAHLTSILQHIAAFCTKARTIFPIFPPSSSSQVQNSAKLPVQHHLEINPRVSDHQNTPGLFEGPLWATSPCYGTANHCSILRKSKNNLLSSSLILL